MILNTTQGISYPGWQSWDDDILHCRLWVLSFYDLVRYIVPRMAELKWKHFGLCIAFYESYDVRNIVPRLAELRWRHFALPSMSLIFLSYPGWQSWDDDILHCLLWVLIRRKAYRTQDGRVEVTTFCIAVYESYDVRHIVSRMAELRWRHFALPSMSLIFLRRRKVYRIQDGRVEMTTFWIAFYESYDVRYIAPRMVTT